MHTLIMFVQKDLIQQGKRLLYGVVLITVFSVSAALTNNGFIGIPFITMLPAVFTLTAITSATYEDDQGGLVFLRVLPIAPQWLALGRYVSALVILLCMYLCPILPILLIRPEALDVAEFALNIFGGICSSLLMVGLTLALFYRFGYRTMRYSFLVIFVSFMIFTSLLSALNVQDLFSGPPPPWLVELLASPAGALVLFGCIALGIYALLCWWAASSIRKRDL